MTRIQWTHLKEVDVGTRDGEIEITQADVDRALERLGWMVPESERSELLAGATLLGAFVTRLRHPLRPAVMGGATPSKPPAHDDGA